MGDRLFKPQDAHKLEDPERQIWLPVTCCNFSWRAAGRQTGQRTSDTI